VATSFADELERRRLMREGWSAECLESERRFGRRVARLYPLIGVENGVRTSFGPGKLLQAFEDQPGQPGAMVLHLRPRSWIERWRSGKLLSRHPAADFVSIEDVQSYRGGRS